MTLEEIQEFWSEDCKIDRTELGDEAIKIPSLHSKYFNIFSRERMLLRQLQETKKQLKLFKFEYYTGVVDEETLREKGIEPFRKKLLRADVDMHIDADVDNVKSNLRIAVQQEKIDFLESIIRTLNNRNYEIASAIKWEQFKVGS